MGIITCEKCKKVYDYEKHNGICPKCARYNRESTSAQEHQEYHNKYDGGYSHTAQDDHHSYHQRYDTNRNPHSSQLDGVQETLREVMGAEHKVTLETSKAAKGKMDKKAKLIASIICVVVFINLLPFFGFLMIPAIIGIAIYFSKKNKK